MTSEFYVESNMKCIDHGCKGYGMGYATAWVVVDGVKRSTTKHRRVHYENTGEWPEVVRHTCDNPRRINPTHLVGGTAVDNMRDMHERGRAGDCANCGSANGRTVLTPTQVNAIRSRYTAGCKENGGMALSREFGISRSQIGRVVRGVHHA